MPRTPTVYDANGRPMRKQVLTREIAAPTFGGVRSPLTGYPTDNMSPPRLTNILREADQGQPIRYLDMAEVMEERDPHYAGVLATRKRSVTQLEITVEDASDAADDKRAADALRDWLRRDELADELFHMLDAIGKGYSITEIVWDFSEGQWWPKHLINRPQRWFEFDRTDLTTLRLLDDTGLGKPMEPAKFIVAQIAAKTGIPARGGLARIVAWPWLFKMLTLRDWAIFTQNFGMPGRIGKYDANATEEDRDKLFNAVANFAGDMAAIIPESMQMEFIESNVTSSVDHYERRVDWLDKQMSKAVIGQTATTDAETGGLGSGKEHRQVQEDIERADAQALAAILNKQLVVPFIALNFPRLRSLPKIRIAREEAEDLKHFSDALAPLIDRGLAVDAEEIYSRFNLRPPAQGATILRPQSAPAPAGPGDDDATGHESAVKGAFKGRVDPGAAEGAARTQAAPERAQTPLEAARDTLALAAADAQEDMLAQIEAMWRDARGFDELRARLLEGFPQVDETGLALVLAQAMTGAHAAGRAEVAAEDAREDGDG